MSDYACHIFGIITTVVCLSSVIVMLWLTRKYYNSMESEQEKPLKYLGFVLFCIQITFCTVNAANYCVYAVVSNCIRGTEFIGSTVVGSIYFAQYFVMILLLFYRLKVVFDGTVYELSQCTILVFTIIYFLGLTSTVPLPFLFDYSGTRSPSLLEIILSLLGLTAAVSTISFVTLLFVKKLVEVNKRCDDLQPNDENNLLSTITKQTILTFISLASLVLFGILSNVHNATDSVLSSIHGAFMYNLCVLFDVWTNFMGIFLGYASFDDYYMRMCGCCDAKCKQLCHRLAETEQNTRVKHKTVGSVSVHNVRSASTV